MTTTSIDVSKFAAGATPKKANDSLTLHWGLVSIPLQVFTGVDDGLKVRRSKFTVDGHEVGNKPYDKTTGDELPIGTQTVMKAAASNGTMVELSDEEQETATGGTARHDATIITFVPAATIGPLYRVTGEHQVRVTPLKNRPNAAGDKAFVLLCTMLAEHDAAAMFQLALRGPSRYAALTADGIMRWVAYSEQIRQPLPMPDVELSKAELDMARMLFDQVGVSTPVPVDENSAKIQAFVDAKAAGRKPEAPAEEAAPVGDVDLLAALQASIAAAPKPKAKKAAKAA